MVLDGLKQAHGRVIGTKETLRALGNGQVGTVFVALDADDRVIGPVVRLAAENGVDVIYADSMRDLGRACGIEVGAASAAIPRI